MPAHEIPDGWMGLDVGPESVHRFSVLLREAKTVFWNGPMGVFEFENFATGTRGVAEAIIANHAMDDLALRERRTDSGGTFFPNLRWIVVHMIEEYARHCGHADLLREAIDGVVGD